MIANAAARLQASDAHHGGLNIAVKNRKRKYILKFFCKCGKLVWADCQGQGLTVGKAAAPVCNSVVQQFGSAPVSNSSQTQGLHETL